jgi:hypothetical protein
MSFVAAEVEADHRLVPGKLAAIAHGGRGI